MLAVFFWINSAGYTCTTPPLGLNIMDTSEQRRVFEALARRKGYDLDRNGSLYANHITNAAYAFFEAGRRNTSPVQEAGPWSAHTTAEHVVYLESEDVHDVRLQVSGNLGGPELTLVYAEELARRLNRASIAAVQPDCFDEFPD